MLSLLNNHLKLTFRNFSRNTRFTFINGFGLILGLTCSLLILLWVNFEKNVDHFHPDGDRIYRAYFNGVSDRGEVTFTQGAAPYALYSLFNEYEGVEKAVFYQDGMEVMLQYDQEIFKEKGALANTSLFEIFDYPMIVGGIENAENDLNTIFLSADLAEKLIGEDWLQNSIGATLRVDDEEVVSIAGVFEKIPGNSSLQFDFIFNAAQRAEENPNWAQHWGAKSATVFAKLAAQVNPRSVEAYVNPIYENTNGYGVGGEAVMLFPFEQNYLWTKFEQGIASGGKIQYIRIFTGAAFFLILIACINFINLSTAQSAKRAKEVGVRKTAGAAQFNLMLQFLFETGVLVFLTLIVSLVASWLLLPFLNTLTASTITMPFFEPLFWGTILSLGLILTFIAGLYPAFVLSNYHPAKVLKSGGATKGGNLYLRRSLVVFQFTLSAILIISTITVRNQLHLIQYEHLGLDRSNVLVMEMSGPVREQYQVLEDKLLQSPSISQVLRSSDPPTDINWINVGFDWEGKTEEQSNYFYMYNTEADFAEVFGIEMAAGRFFDENIKSDTAGVIINETGLAQMDLADPVGKTIFYKSQETHFRILGIMKDFNFKSLHQKIEPLMVKLDPKRTSSILIKTAPGETVNAIAQLKESWSEVFPNYPLAYDFLDDTYAAMYQSEMIIGRLAYIFAGIAILISCLGLFGLISFIALQKTKEIGIRKVLGASIVSIVGLLSRDFVKLVILALIIAAPLAWYLMDQWLMNFAFRAGVHWWVYVLTGLIALAVTLLTVSYQSIRAALVNPIHSLKSE